MQSWYEINARAFNGRSPSPPPETPRAEDQKLPDPVPATAAEAGPNRDTPAKDQIPPKDSQAEVCPENRGNTRNALNLMEDIKN